MHTQCRPFPFSLFLSLSLSLSLVTATGCLHQNAIALQTPGIEENLRAHIFFRSRSHIYCQEKQQARNRSSIWIKYFLDKQEENSKIEHLLSLPESKEKLELVEADLLDESSLLAAVKGCDRVFGVAIPLLDPSQDQSAMIELAMTSTMNLLKACSESQCVKRVVMTSSYFAAVKVPHEEGEFPFEIDESWWTSVEYCKQQNIPFSGYMVAKTLAEKAALDYAKENNLDVISILPSLVGGPFLTPSIPRSITVLLAIMTTEVQSWMTSLVGYMSYVHVDDAIRAHILLMEDPSAKGRYLCSAVDGTLSNVLHDVLPLLKSHNIPPPKLISSQDEDSSKAYYKINTNKLKDMGFSYEYDTIHKIFKDTMLFVLEKGYFKEL